MKKEIEQSLGNIIESVESRTLQEDIAKIEAEVEAVVESDTQTSEEFIDACFPEASPELKAKIAMFSGVYYDLFLSQQE